ncbi:alpha/beta fold hydrolase [Myceligenerans pegani]|uniref:Alpha/beta fold hydrolase n=1 Tax=Myceligenerans pegani TaxID=2776917 RepID=A0ABR9MYK4_9MICO|nr:alpha/beta fold hydrolase [Myceligenerans sp. TRM 65318]MBE1876096.1 alpha/beta fold hydrolase [Myceligenerans sp. TRM 65318]MBE3018367.1 alpha/beta fold hydrolase [Myceligenerans sp. TRM 65318]
MAQPGGAAGPTTPTRDAPAIPEIAWGSCDDGADAFDCASVEVPSDYDRPHGPTTTVAATRLPATDPANRIGSVFVNFGGPGGEGVSTLHQLGEQLFEPSVRERFDIVSFDPRGVGQSDPATCYPDQESEFEATSRMLTELPTTRREEARYILEAAQLGFACTTTSPDRFSTASSANVARDMDVLRQAVGDDELTYVGYSYGTILGATYGMLFPDSVRAMVLDGPLDPREWSGVGSDELVNTRLLQPRGAHEAFAELWRLCEEAGPAGCSTASLGDPAAIAEQVLTAIQDTPVEVPIGDGETLTYTYTTLVFDTFFSLYGVDGYAPVADFYTYLAAELGLVDTARSRTAATDLDLSRFHRRVEDYPSVGTQLATFCADAETPGNPWAYPRKVAELNEQYPHFGLARGWLGIHCEFMPLQDEDAWTGPWHQSVDAPVLVIGTRFDPATHYDHTAPYASLWPDARTLTIEGYGHTTLSVGSPCGHAAIAEYLVNLTATDGAACEAAQPFGPAEPATTRQELPGLPFAGL